MLLAVAGLDSEQILDRTARLATGDWASFTPSERTAFSFAGRLTREPWAISHADTQSLVTYFGEERALDVVWWSCRCHYMTCVADALQLPVDGDLAPVDHICRRIRELVEEVDDPLDVGGALLLAARNGSW